MQYDKRDLIKLFKEASTWHWSSKPKYYSYPLDFTLEASGYEKTTVQVIKDSCTNFKYYTPKSLLLNMSSDSQPGGGVERGATAQEEFLCRTSNLYNCLPKKSQRLHYLEELEAIYNDQVIFKKDANYQPIKPHTVAVISMAALKRPRLPLSDHHKQIYLQKMKLLLDIAAKHKHYDLILSAWGCGAYKNPPETIARLFKQAFEEHVIKFNVIFLINDNNYDIFSEVFQV